MSRLVEKRMRLAAQKKRIKELERQLAEGKYLRDETEKLVRLLERDATREDFKPHE
jgi:uncharacterized coiled-coil protein SlyX